MSTPAILNIIVIGCIKPSDSLPLKYSAPDFAAMSPSPEESITILAMTASLPDLLSIIAPLITFSSIIASEAKVYNLTITPSFTSVLSI